MMAVLDHKFIIQVRGLRAHTNHNTLGSLTRLNINGRELLARHEVESEECVWISLTILVRGQPYLSLWEVQAKFPTSVGLILQDISRRPSRLCVRRDGRVRQRFAVTINHAALNNPPFNLLSNFLSLPHPHCRSGHTKHCHYPHP